MLPGEHDHGVSKREAELDVIPGIEEAAGEVHGVFRSIPKERVSTPRDPVVGRKTAGSLGLIEEDGLAQRTFVVVGLAGDLTHHQERCSSEQTGNRNLNLKVINICQ